MPDPLPGSDWVLAEGLPRGQWAVLIGSPLGLAAFLVAAFLLDGFVALLGLVATVALGVVLMALDLFLVVFMLDRSSAKAVRPGPEGVGIRTRLGRTFVVPWAACTIRDAPRGKNGVLQYTAPVAGWRILTPSQYAAVKAGQVALAPPPRFEAGAG